MKLTLSPKPGGGLSLKGWLVASKGLGLLPRMRWGA